MAAVKVYSVPLYILIIYGKDPKLKGKENPWF